MTGVDVEGVKIAASCRSLNKTAKLLRKAMKIRKADMPSNLSPSQRVNWLIREVKSRI